MDIYKTDLNLLRVFDALMRSKSVTRAGDLLNLSQPSVSFALNKLRVLCADELFVRTPGGVQPTPRALKMANPVRQALELIQRDVFQTVEFMPSTSEREFRIGLGDIAEMIFLPKILKRFREQAPGITVRTANLPLEVLEQEMIAGDIDVVIGFYPNFSKGNFYQQHLFRDDFVCMMRAGHPALRRNFDLKDFCDALHVVPSPGNRRQDMFEDYLRSLGINRKVVFSTPHYLCIPYMVLSSDVVVTVPRECIEPFSLLPGLHFVETPFKSPVFDVKQHWHAMYHGDPANRWLRALLYECFAANGPEPVAGTR